MTNRASTESKPYPENYPSCCAYHGGGGAWYQECGGDPERREFGMPYFWAKPGLPDWSSCPYCRGDVVASVEGRTAHLLGACPMRPVVGGNKVGAQAMLDEVEGLQGRNERKALRVLFSAMDGAILRGDYAFCEDVLGRAEPSRLGVMCATGLLAVTLRNVWGIPSRPRYFLRVREYLRRERPTQVGSLLAGLG